jgi:hypothetical protein
VPWEEHGIVRFWVQSGTVFIRPFQNSWIGDNPLGDFGKLVDPAPAPCGCGGLALFFCARTAGPNDEHNVTDGYGIWIGRALPLDSQWIDGANRALIRIDTFGFDFVSAWPTTAGAGDWIVASERGDIAQDPDVAQLADGS